MCGNQAHCLSVASLRDLPQLTSASRSKRAYHEEALSSAAEYALLRIKKWCSPVHIQHRSTPCKPILYILLSYIEYFKWRLYRIQYFIISPIYTDMQFYIFVKISKDPFPINTYNIIISAVTNIRLTRFCIRF